MNGKTMHGNCDLRFLKGGDQAYSLIREKPQRAVWWIEKEERSGHTFRADRPSYRSMYEAALGQREMFTFGDESIEDCACTD